jgi:hypothetical protein
MQIFNCAQGSTEWFACRMGIPTASQFATVMASGRGGAESKTRRTYMLKLAGEIITGEPMDSVSNRHTERGHEMEPEARSFYAFQNDVEPELVGFIRNGQTGGSPDSLVGNDGMLEIKTKLPHLLAEVILKGDFPAEHHAQCQGQLWVAEREWIDLVCYWPKMPKFIIRAYRDEEYIKQIASAIDQFNEELADVVERLRARYMAEAA